MFAGVPSRKPSAASTSTALAASAARTDPSCGAPHHVPRDATAARGSAGRHAGRGAGLGAGRGPRALAANAVDVLAADGFLLGTPANIGYLSGALKHFFDTVYYPCLTAKVGAPYGLYVHGNEGTDGAVRAAQSITKGMGWRPVHDPVAVMGAPTKADTEAVWELAATVAASLLD